MPEIDTDGRCPECVRLKDTFHEIMTGTRPDSYHLHEFDDPPVFGGEWL